MKTFLNKVANFFKAIGRSLIKFSKKNKFPQYLMVIFAVFHLAFMKTHIDAIERFSSDFIGLYMFGTFLFAIILIFICFSVKKTTIANIVITSICIIGVVFFFIQFIGITQTCLNTQVKVIDSLKPYIGSVQTSILYAYIALIGILIGFILYLDKSITKFVPRFAKFISTKISKSE